MKKLNILVACEYSGEIRERLRAAGHNAWSCDLLPSNDDSNHHYVGDCFDLIDNPSKVLHSAWKWDVLIAFPPCTYLTVSGAWLFAERDQIKRNVAEGVKTGAERYAAQVEAIDFVKRLMNCGIPNVVVENPSRSYLCTHYRQPDQVVHPYQFGDDASKSTGFWIKGSFPGLKIPLEFLWVKPRMIASAKTGKLPPRWGNQTDSGQNCEPPGALRWKKRSDTWPGIAQAMTEGVDLWHSLGGFE